jgi:hypothetical protein
MVGLTFVIEKALDRLVEPRPERHQSHTDGRARQTMFRRLIPGFSAHLHHRPARQSND